MVISIKNNCLILKERKANSMNEQLILFALLQLHKSNFEVLHWKCYGCDYDTLHKEVTSQFYEDFAEDADTVAENLMRQGMNPGNYFSVMRILRETEHLDFVDDTKLYTRNEVVQKCDEILKCILEQIEKCLQTPEIKENIKNVGIKSFYEGMYDKYDKEYRFLNKRRIEQ